MDHKKKNRKLGFVPQDKALVSILGISLFLLMALLMATDVAPEWRGYQSEFRSMVEEKLGPDHAERIPSGIQQVYVSELGTADRCVTCHQGIGWKGLENTEQPFRTHPVSILEHHPVDRFGCTPCHGGQGYATSLPEAHGLVEHWEEPMLGNELGEFYVISDRDALMQINCNNCHRYERETPGMPYINRAKKILNDRGCRACHIINGRGGSLGPDLTWEGEKSPEQFTFERIRGFHSEFTWQVAHMKNPKELVPESVMPNFNFSSEDAQSLAMLVMSWKKSSLPIDYIPGHNFRDVPTAEELEKERRMLEGPGSFFVKKNCFVCHSVSTLGIDAAAQIGPDLSMAVSDVQSRFGRTLDDFMEHPTGTMEVVLSTMITLSPDERKEAVEKLRLAWKLKQEQTESGGTRH